MSNHMKFHVIIDIQNSTYCALTVSSHMSPKEVEDGLVIHSDGSDLGYLPEWREAMYRSTGYDILNN
jgi:hypothetical protein